MIRTATAFSTTLLVSLLLALTPGTASADDNVRLYVFDCGLIGAADISMFNLSNDETPVRELFVPCYLIEHPEGRLIWDAGLPLAMAGAGRIEQEGGVYMDYERSLIDQLAAYKMNTLHLHLSDDEGWRLQIPGLPELTTIGSTRRFQLDSDGNVWSSAGEGVHWIGPDGPLLGKILVSELVSNVYFGGRAKHELFATASTSV